MRSTIYIPDVAEGSLTTSSRNLRGYITTARSTGVVELKAPALRRDGLLMRGRVVPVKDEFVTSPAVVGETFEGLPSFVVLFSATNPPPVTTQGINTSLSALEREVARRYKLHNILACPVRFLHGLDCRGNQGVVLAANRVVELELPLEALTYINAEKRGSEWDLDYTNRWLAKLAPVLEV